MFGKFLNCGQTCVAPDYVLADSAIADRLTEAVIAEIGRQLGEHPLDNPEYGRIVNEKHFDRLCGLMDKVAYGGETDRAALRIAPTVMTGVTWDDPVMREEIFGPLLPILTFDRFEDVIPTLRALPKPLALYLFSEDSSHIRTALDRLPSGGCCVNDTIIHLATSAMAFGGVGASGMGAYHGKAGFDAFSHTRSVVDKRTWIDLPMRYHPYTGRLNRALVRLFLR